MPAFLKHNQNGGFMKMFILALISLAASFASAQMNIPDVSNGLDQLVEAGRSYVLASPQVHSFAQHQLSGRVTGAKYRKPFGGNSRYIVSTSNGCSFEVYTVYGENFFAGIQGVEIATQTARCK